MTQNKRRGILGLVWIFILTSFNFAGIDFTKNAEALYINKNYSDVKTDKIWKIEFEKELKGTIKNINKVKVYDEYFNYIETIRYYADNNRTIVVKPKENYEKASRYYMFIERNLEAKDGQLFGKEYRIEFTTEGFVESTTTETKKTVKELKVTIDPGQVLQDYVEGNGISGRALNLEIAELLGFMLKKEGIDVEYTRVGNTVSWNRDTGMSSRAKIANDFKSDYMVSIYSNLSDTNTSNGIETYYAEGNSKDQAFAEEIQSALIKATGAYDRGAKSRPDFELFEKSNMPSIIVETGFLTNKQDAENLKKSSYKENIAEAIKDVLVKKMRTKTITETKTTGTKPTVKSVSKTIDSGDDFNLPTKFTATYKNSNQKKEMAVTWNRVSYDIYTPGTYYSYGVIESGSKKIIVEYKLIVKGEAIEKPKDQEDQSKPEDNKEPVKEPDNKDDDKEKDNNSGSDKSQDKDDNSSKDKEDDDKDDSTDQHVVTINASRGGNDSGVVANGIKEKELNLEVALKAGKLLEDNGFKVIYTRDSDYVTWNSSNEIVKRVEISDSNKSELMVNIGANAVESDTPEGIETYYREGNKDGKRAAQLIQDNIIQKTGATYRGIIGNTSLNTLRLSNAPAVWVAIGFLSNEEEAARLKEEAYKDRIALGIANAVKEYFSGDSEGIQQVNHAKEITKRIKQGESFTLPKTVDIILGNNGEERVNVTWDSSSVNTSKAGVFKYEGSIKGREDKVVLTLIIGNTKSTGYKVVLDPGHGGYDSGAIGYTKLREKDITLEVSLMIGDYLVRNGVDVEYTRTSDRVSWPSNVSKDLKVRTEIANNHKPDLFISLHLNSTYNDTANGIETYAFYGSSEGYILASYIQNELIKYTGGYNRGIKQKGFYVIKYSDAPAALVELGFLSNKEEEARFKSTEEKKKYARAVASGIFKKLGVTNYDVTD